MLAIDDVRAAVRMQVRPVMAERSDLAAALDRFVRSDGELDELSTAIVEESSNSTDVAVNEPAEDDAPIVRFVNLLISQAIQDHASDIHIEPAENDLNVRYRIDGVLHEFSSIPGVVDDVTDIILNLKRLRISYNGDKPITCRI